MLDSRLFGKLKSLICCNSINGNNNVGDSNNNINGQYQLNENDDEKEPLINNNDALNLPHEQIIGIDNININDSDYDGQYVLVNQDKKITEIKQKESQFDDEKEEQGHIENGERIEQKYDNNPNMQILISNIQQLPNKDAVNVLLHYLHEENVKYTSYYLMTKNLSTPINL